MATEVRQPMKKVKVWKGEKRSGPAPARHIPWPEIFKHHISVVEGHTKMLEMVQKHTVQGSGNYETITNLVKRSHDMLWQAKDVSRSFVPPKNQRESVPLGSSSETMYPGYSPAHIEYGRAAGEFGQAVGEMKARGEEWKPANGAEYQIGQSHGAKRKMLLRKERTESTGSDEAAKDASSNNADEKVSKGDDEVLGFVIDTKPTPVQFPVVSRKRPIEEDSEGVEKKKEKKKKKSKEDIGEKEPVIETEDISAEVDARLKAKEEKKKAKEERKRHRESNGDEEKVVKKAKKDKTKKRELEADEEGSGDGEGKKNKRKKNKAAE